MLKRFKNWISSRKTVSVEGTSCQIIPQADHQLDHHLISRNALRVIETLQRAGFSAFLVGGGIRDLLLGGKPKDFDVATNATPEETKKLFRNALIIGRRFRIVHVRFGREIIETTTFRAHHDNHLSHRDAQRSATGQLLRDNVFGDIESDAARRDFTVNALYYDPSTGELFDFVSGLDDLQHRTLRIIGDPDSRYREDPVRMLRAVRFAAKLGFSLDATTAQPIYQLAPLLADIPSARLFEEVLKLMLNGSATATLELLLEYRLFEHLFPGTAACLTEADSQAMTLVTQTMVNTDKRIRREKRVTPAFIYAALLWLPLRVQMRELVKTEKLSPAQAMQQAAQGVIGQQLSATSIPKRFLIPLREIWSLQLRLPQRQGQKAFELLGHPRFRAAYDFVLLREESGESLDGLGAWWTRFQDADETQRQEMVDALGKPPARRRPRKRRRKPSDSGTPPPPPSE